VELELAFDHVEAFLLAVLVRRRAVLWQHRHVDQRVRAVCVFGPRKKIPGDASRPAGRALAWAQWTKCCSWSVIALSTARFSLADAELLPRSRSRYGLEKGPCQPAVESTVLAADEILKSVALTVKSSIAAASRMVSSSPDRAWCH
jgi:hypothetical protein